MYTYVEKVIKQIKELEDINSRTDSINLSAVIFQTQLRDKKKRLSSFTV